MKEIAFLTIISCMILLGCDDRPKSETKDAIEILLVLGLDFKCSYSCQDDIATIRCQHNKESCLYEIKREKDRIPDLVDEVSSALPEGRVDFDSFDGGLMKISRNDGSEEMIYSGFALNAEDNQLSNVHGSLFQIYLELKPCL